MRPGKNHDDAMTKLHACLARGRNAQRSFVRAIRKTAPR